MGIADEDPIQAAMIPSHNCSKHNRSYTPESPLVADSLLAIGRTCGSRMGRKLFAGCHCGLVTPSRDPSFMWYTALKVPEQSIKMPANLATSWQDFKNP